MSHPLHVDIAQAPYRALIGVGGIGAGLFFALQGNHTLGREESRLGHFLPRRDYCKLHIIAHYVQTLLGSSFATIPIGKVGEDEMGVRLLHEMREAGLDTRYVQVAPGLQTLFSFCFIYPDGSGGNLTTDDSACAHVDAAYVRTAEPEFARFAGCGIALAAPEVPLAARQALLELGTRYRMLRVASFATGELAEAIELGMLRHVDLLALNRSEAAAFAGLAAEEHTPTAIARAATERLGQMNPDAYLTVTAGAHGSWSWDGHALVHRPAIRVNAVSTAGAGDAFLAGVLVGLVARLRLHQAHELGVLVAAHAVTSPHTINKETDRVTLWQLAEAFHVPLSEAVRRLLTSQDFASRCIPNMPEETDSR
ncbi:MAG: PfkB family carbohydrate kinase [Anaerolineae bacterium]|nr:PfkB family carbohydrate kinase [Anaerolineae bacterium]MDW8070918.1 PfkB family carbohydrate kinase [Anaerolineae bacterium]